MAPDPARQAARVVVAVGGLVVNLAAFAILARPGRESLNIEAALRHVLADVLGLDMLLSVYFLGLVMGFRARPNWLPVVVVSALAAVLAVKFVGSPWHVSLGALAGVSYAGLAVGRRP
mgnify:CR=1 FL=1